MWSRLCGVFADCFFKNILASLFRVIHWIVFARLCTGPGVVNKSPPPITLRPLDTIVADGVKANITLNVHTAKIFHANSDANSRSQLYSHN